VRLARHNIEGPVSKCRCTSHFVSVISSGFLRNLKLGKVVGRFSAARFNEPTPFILVPCLNVETFCFSRLIFCIFDEISEIYLSSEIFFEFRLSIGRLTFLSSPRKTTLSCTNP
jgi:hypothetical protein